MPSPDWLIKNFHHRWYPDETLDVAIGQGAVEATPMQLARIIGGIASGGHLVRPHVIFPNELSGDFYKSLVDSFPGTGEAYVPIDPANWDIITNGMAEVTQPGLYHTAGSAHLEGIDIAGKTGTAQQMSHEALEKTNKGRATYPNVWFVGLVPRRNPELVVAVLWENGEFSYYPARIGAQVVAAFVNKKRREAHNLPPTKAAAPVEVGAVWTTPDSGPDTKPGAKGSTAARIHSGHFFVDGNGNVAEDPKAAQKHETGRTTPQAPASAKNSPQVAALVPATQKEH
jgi:penicillin-binding protein 2